MNLIDSINSIKLDKSNNVKTIRFSEEEIHLLKYLEYRKRRFSEYVKELIHKDLESYIKDSEGYFTIEDIREIVKEEIKNIE